MLQHLLDEAKAAGFIKPVVVIGHKAGDVRKFLKGKAVAVIQKRQLGTADAVKVARRELSRFDDIVVLYGDVPLVRRETLRSLIREHRSSGSSCTVLAVDMDDPSGYGRIIRDYSGGVKAIIEDKEAAEDEKKIREINVGIYCFRRHDLYRVINKIRRSKVKKEFYLTDIIAILISEGKRVSAFKTDDADESIGINSRAELAKAFSILNKRVVEKLMRGSVTVLDPATTFISPDAKIGKDTVIYPFTVIDRDVVIGRRCEIGPFCRLRPGTVIEDAAEVGNFVEIVRSTLRSRAKAKHLTYLGDAVVGRDTKVVGEAEARHAILKMLQSLSKMERHNTGLFYAWYEATEETPSVTDNYVPVVDNANLIFPGTELNIPD